MNYWNYEVLEFEKPEVEAQSKARRSSEAPKMPTFIESGLLEGYKISPKSWKSSLE